MFESRFTIFLTINRAALPSTERVFVWFALESSLVVGLTYFVSPAKILRPLKGPNFETLLHESLRSQ